MQLLSHHKLCEADRDLVPSADWGAIDIVCGVPGDVCLEEGNAVLALGGVGGGGPIWGCMP